MCSPQACMTTRYTDTGYTVTRSQRLACADGHRLGGKAMCCSHSTEPQALEVGMGELFQCSTGNPCSQWCCQMRGIHNCGLAEGFLSTRAYGALVSGGAAAILCAKPGGFVRTRCSAHCDAAQPFSILPTPGTLRQLLAAPHSMFTPFP